jgi:hypothetical protein
LNVGSDSQDYPLSALQANRRIAERHVNEILGFYGQSKLWQPMRNRMKEIAPNMESVTIKIRGLLG